MAGNLVKNTRRSYGVLFISIHWLMAIAILSLFALGLWMVELDYYSEWYRIGPDIHRSIGVLVGLLLLVRLLYKMFSATPAPHGSDNAQAVAFVAHVAMYLGIALVVMSGYLISTADGRAVEVFGWFEVPALSLNFPQQEEFFGKVHLFSAYFLIGLTSLHAVAAFKHHFIDRDDTLKRMLGISNEQ